MRFDFTLPLAAMSAGSGGGFVYAFQQTTLEAKIIIVLLAIGSIYSWAIMITKIDTLRRARTMSDRFIARFRAETDPLALFSRGERFDGSPLFSIYLAGCQELAFQKMGSAEVDDLFGERLRNSRKLSPVAMGAVRAALERTVGENALRLESKMVLLATAVSGAPFLGLLGTVWGVMDTFAGVAMAGRATLAAMAPGVSAALMTTVTGLLVAIPAMFGYNFLVATIRAFTVEMDNFAAELAAAMDHHYLDTKS